MACPREKREMIERTLVGEFGVRAENSKGRRTPEPECEIRTCFQRDVDRITHSKAFRRLKHKTQVYLRPEGDHYRTRLTHTLEVSRLARTIARALDLNEDLTEAMALGHDLGHTPFGHAGERALNKIYEEGFKHYEQSLRVVDILERDGRGLNLCYETRMGILHHTHGAPDDTTEATVVRLADRIAYINHDLDDTIRAGILRTEDVPDMIRTRCGERNSERINSIMLDLIENSGGGKIQMSDYMQEAVDRLELWRTRDITDLEHAEHKVIWIPKDPSNAHHLWGPEIHPIAGKWYVYYAASDDNMDNHQLFVLENSSADPFEGEFELKGRISTDKNNNWAIHPNVFEHRGEWYMTWSGWQSRRVSTEHQCIYIAKMKNPWTLESDRVLLSKPEFEWERQWINPDGSKTAYTIYVNESPQFYKSRKGDKIFIFYSASGTWTCFYAVGMLMADADSDLLDPDSWTKSTRPVFKQCPENKVYGPGHVSFIPSPDGKEDYLLYDARSVENDPAGSRDSRTPRLQKIEWDKDGIPYLGVPLPLSVRLNKPSGL